MNYQLLIHYSISFQWLHLVSMIRNQTQTFYNKHWSIHKIRSRSCKLQKPFEIKMIHFEVLNYWAMICKPIMLEYLLMYYNMLIQLWYYCNITVVTMILLNVVCCCMLLYIVVFNKKWIELCICRIIKVKNV